MPRPRPPHLHSELSRHGKRVWYHRIGKGKRTRIDHSYGSAEFWAAYQAAEAGEDAPKPAKAGVNTFRWLVDRYRGSLAWAALSVATRRQRENVLRPVLEKSGNEPLSAFTQKAIAKGRDKRASTPSAARHFVVALRHVFQWAVEASYMTSDPTQGVKVPRPATDGHHPWSEDELTKFEEKWPLGTRERLAYDVLLYTGLRRGDAAVIGRQHIRDATIKIKTEKTGELVIIPVLPPLQTSIDAAPKGDMTLIIGEHGRGFTKESFGNWFGAACRTAGVPGTAHGLRKAAATRMAEAGASEADLEAVFGWRGGRMASLYTKKANRERIGRRGALLMLKAKD